MAGGRKELMDYLENLGITSETVEHPAVFTVEAMMPYVGHLPGAHSKNLFLKDKKKKRLWLFTALATREINLGDLAKKVGASGGFRFCGRSSHVGKTWGRTGLCDAPVFVQRHPTGSYFLVGRKFCGR